MHPEFQRVAIVNRGEAAMRFINAVREFNQERGTSIGTIALYTDPDRKAMFVREADEAFCLGPATVVDEADGQRKVSYLDYRRLESALAASKADAVWTGWGFVSEHAGFAERHFVEARTANQVGQVTRAVVHDAGGVDVAQLLGQQPLDGRPVARDQCAGTRTLGLEHRMADGVIDGQGVSVVAHFRACGSASESTGKASSTARRHRLEAR